MADDIVFHDRWGHVVSPGPEAKYRRRAAIYALARSRGDAILAVEPKRGHGTLQLPGGGIEPGEEPLEALRREWQEETGIDFSPLSQASRTHTATQGFYNENLREFWIYRQTFCLCRYDADAETGSVWRNPEGDAASWFALSRLAEMPFAHQHRAGIVALLPGLSFKPFAQHDPSAQHNSSRIDRGG